ncbi:MAG: PhoU domain-containing protein [Armatimonadota bacterium]|nr:PhoU domain-containing protein [Armatimonadota bacterium]MDR7568370.1 PhoU domain-containing protein [Armatimonadota bacterium]
MGSLVGDLIHRVVEALKRQDVMADAVIEEDDVVDRLHLDLEERVAKLLATQQPWPATSGCSRLCWPSPSTWSAWRTTQRESRRPPSA